jgi:hypothetical protein
MRKHPLISFFVLASALTWWICPLLKPDWRHPAGKLGYAPKRIERS